MVLYILKSLKDNSHYIGITQNFENRLRKHNKGEVLSTRSKKPWIATHKEWYKSRSEAFKREKYLKSLKKRKSLEKFIYTPSSSSLV